MTTTPSQWQANERRLIEIAAMIGVGREMHAAEPGALEASQGEVEFELGFEGAAQLAPLVWCPVGGR